MLLGTALRNERVHNKSIVFVKGVFKFGLLEAAFRPAKVMILAET